MSEYLVRLVVADAERLDAPEVSLDPKVVEAENISDALAVANVLAIRQLPRKRVMRVSCELSSEGE